MRTTTKPRPSVIKNRDIGACPYFLRRIDHIEAPVIDQVRNTLGPAFVSLSLVPEGMAFMLVEIKFRS